jgi:hypothetical protein
MKETGSLNIKPRDPDSPPGWSYNPSTWPERLPDIALALIGFGLATYLTLYQVNAIHSVYEPFFGVGSHYVLKESIVPRYLPIPDAALGAGAYLVDAIADSIGGRRRWRTMPWMVLILAAFACGLAVIATVLTVFQGVLARHWCTLCLCSAFCSVAMLGAVLDEVLATLQYLRRQWSGHGPSGAWRALWGWEP